MSNGTTPAGWYQDPTGQGEARYWNGTSWTQSVFRDGTNINVAIDPAQAQQPPVPGTQMQLPTTAPAQPTTVVTQKSGSSAGAVIFGVIALILVIVVIVAIVNSSDSDDTPTPGTEAPAATQPAAPATTAPADGG
jgi:hypothetical protein